MRSTLDKRGIKAIIQPNKKQEKRVIRNESKYHLLMTVTACNGSKTDLTDFRGQKYAVKNKNVISGKIRGLRG